MIVEKIQPVTRLEWKFDLFVVPYARARNLPLVDRIFILTSLQNILFFNSDEIHIIKLWQQYIIEENEWKRVGFINLKETYFRPFMDDSQWLNKYHEKIFFELFRIKKETFEQLVTIGIMESDQHNLLKKKYRVGNSFFYGTSTWLHKIR
jgi:hypothetical protein